jgi:hypothetical protein
VAARVIRLAVRAAAVALVAAALAGCLSSGDGTPRPTTTPMAAPTLSAAVGPTIASVTQALAGAGIQVQPAQVPYRPAEATPLAAAPRWTLQALLANEPTHGFITIYELPDGAAAQVAAETQAAYVASGPGRVQFPSDAQFAIRRLGSTVVFYSWSPGSSTDPRAAGIIGALGELGSEIAVPR